MSETELKKVLDCKKDSVGITVILIIILLGIIIMIMIYNYWMLFRCQNHKPPADLFNNRICAFNRESFNGESFNGSSDKISNILSNKLPDKISDGELYPIVRSVLDDVVQYKEGVMSHRLKQHIAHHNKTQPGIIQPNNTLPGIIQPNNTPPGIVQPRIIQPTNTQSNNTQSNNTQSNNTQPTNTHPTNTKYHRGEPINSTNTSWRQKTDTPEKGMFKIVIYHMPRCGHCQTIMEPSQGGQKSQFEELGDIFKTDPTIEIMDFQLGRDNEAKKIKYFPTIMFITEHGADEHQGGRDALSIAKAVVDKRN